MVAYSSNRRGRLSLVVAAVASIGGIAILVSVPFIISSSGSTNRGSRGGDDAESGATQDTLMTSAHPTSRAPSSMTPTVSPHHTQTMKPSQEFVGGFVPSLSSEPVTHIPSYASSRPSSVPSELLMDDLSFGAPSGPPSSIPSTQFSHNASYVPGEMTVVENKLRLSTGLRSRIIARTGKRVSYANGTRSRRRFHGNPDGAAVFSNPSSGGWVYVSSSEMRDDKGGVGAISFDKDGNVVGYKMVLRKTNRNCSGGRTTWHTFVSCEENGSRGQIYEVDPFGRMKAQKTVLGGKGGNFESFAVDSRDPLAPHFFVTNDRIDGEVRRFTPNATVVRDAVNGGDHWKILSTPGKLEYLVLQPINESSRVGKYMWAADISAGKKSAKSYFQYTEGIDHHNGLLYFVAKKQQEVIVLDLDDDTFSKFSTMSEQFSGEPDQLKFIRGDSGVMYFTEDRRDNKPAGVYARDSIGNFFTVLEELNTSNEAQEVNGLAFSPDNRHLYVAMLKPGIVFDITRDDGRPFDGRTLDIRYHSLETSID